MTSAAPPRRRFRFSLRTLFVLVTVLSVWLGVQMKWIRDRHTALREARPFVRFSPHTSGMFQVEHAAPWSIRIFGEQPVNTILVHAGGGNDYSEDELKRLFPEARVGVASHTPFFTEPEAYPFPP